MDDDTRHTDGRDRGTQDLPTNLILPLASPIIIIIIIISSSSRRRSSSSSSSSSRRRSSSSSSISRLHWVALSWAILSLTTPKLLSLSIYIYIYMYIAMYTHNAQ